MKICLYDSGIGVLPFLKVILRHNIGNDYYIFVDHDNFPYGEKNDKELLDLLINNINKLKKYNFDYIFLCCNTMSYIYLKNRFLFDIKIRTILEYNLNNLSNIKLLGTNNLCSHFIDKSINGSDLAKLIEKNEIKKIIRKIKKIDEPIILSCTHYHLIKDLLFYYQVNFLSNEEKIFEGIEYNNQVNIYIKKCDQKIIAKFLKIGINFY